MNRAGSRAAQPFPRLVWRGYNGNDDAWWYLAFMFVDVVLLPDAAANQRQP